MAVPVDVATGPGGPEPALAAPGQAFEGRSLRQTRGQRLGLMRVGRPGRGAQLKQGAPPTGRNPCRDTISCHDAHPLKPLMAMEEGHEETCQAPSGIVADRRGRAGARCLQQLGIVVGRQPGERHGCGYERRHDHDRLGNPAAVGRPGAGFHHPGHRALLGGEYPAADVQARRAGGRRNADRAGAGAEPAHGVQRRQDLHLPAAQRPALLQRAADQGQRRHLRAGAGHQDPVAGRLVRERLHRRAGRTTPRARRRRSRGSPPTTPPAR